MGFTEDELHELLGTQLEQEAQQEQEAQARPEAKEAEETAPESVPEQEAGPEGGTAPENDAAPEAEAERVSRQAEIDRAVDAALAREREQTQSAWKDFFARAKLKNSFTGEDITTKEQFDAWSADFEAARLERELKEGKLTPETLNKAVAENPAVKKAEELLRRDEAARQAREKEAFDAKVAREIEEIGRMDPGIRSVEDLLKMPDADKFREYVRRGNSFLDAWYLTNRGKMEASAAQAAAQAAKQQALTAARSKDHLSPAGNARGAGAASVPAEDMELFRLMNPDATEAEIQAYYNKNKKI